MGLQQPIINQNLTIMNNTNRYPPQYLIQSQQQTPMPQQLSIAPNQYAFLIPIGTHYQYQPQPQPPPPQNQYYYPPMPPSQAFIPMIPSNITSINQHLPKFPLLPLISTTESNHSMNLSSASPSSQILSNIKCDTKLFKTEGCSDNDSNSSTVSSKSHKNASYECSECHKSFKHKSNLKIHFIIHTEDALQCSHCDKRFARKSNLTQHLRVHTGERPYICTFCNKSFKVKHNMVVHRRQHNGEKPYQCPLCFKKFASKSSLNGHTKKIHPNQWWSLHPDCKEENKKNIKNVHVKV